MHLDTLQEKKTNNQDNYSEVFKEWCVRQYCQEDACSHLIIFPQIDLAWPFNWPDLNLDLPIL